MANGEDPGEITRHLIRVSTVCLDNIDIQRMKFMFRVCHAFCLVITALWSPPGKRLTSWFKHLLYNKQSANIITEQLNERDLTVTVSLYKPSKGGMLFNTTSVIGMNKI